MAVLSNDQYEIFRLLQKHPKCLEERGYPLGQTPVQLALGNPECLRLLVERCSPRLLVQSDRSYHTTLGYAILLSKSLCDRREDQDESSCRCTLPLRILLEGGCPIIPYLDFKTPYDRTLIAHASQHCKVYLAKSLLQRRQELKSIALQYLSSLEIDKFSLHKPVALDIYAMQVDEILRHRGIIEFGPLSTYLEEDDIDNEPPVQDCRSIYHELSNVKDANIYFNLGFHDVTAHLDKPKKSWPSEHGFSHHKRFPFVKWLLDHDAPLWEWGPNWSLPWTGFISDAFVLAILSGHGLQNVWVRGSDEELVRELEEQMLVDDSLDSCECRCSPGGCTPFVVRMKYMRLRDNELDIATTITAYCKEYGNVLRREHCYAAIRFITFQALGIAHTCCCRYGLVSKLDAEEIAEIQDEYAELLEVLESLTEEFEARVCEIFDSATDGLESMITFWSDYWVRRMTQVLSELSEADETSKSAAEDLGIIWQPKPEREVWVKPSSQGWQGWDYYFAKIEEIE